MEPSTEAPIFHALLSGLSVLSRVVDRRGYHDRGFHVLIPSEFGAELEQEMQRCNPEAWEPFCNGIGVYADGHLKQLILTDTIRVGWKTGPIRNRRKSATWSPTPADRTRQPTTRP
jgi:hypothetical protein